jgi:hypothetical protein
MRPSLPGRAALLVSVLAGAAAPAHAFVRTKTDRGAAVHWKDSCIYVTAHVVDAPMNLPPELAVDAARAAAAAWSAPQVDCTALQMQISVSAEPAGDVANDGHSNVMFRQGAGNWCRQPRSPEDPCYDPQALAITTVFAQQNDGLVLDADTEINAVDFTWGDLETGQGASGSAQDLQNTLTHEFGHLLGLDHNCYSSADRMRGIDQDGNPVPDCNRAPQSVQQATMYASVMRGDILRRTLSPDDIAGVCAIYPGSGAAVCTAAGDGDPPAQRERDDGGCALGRGRPGLSGAAALALVALLVARRRLSARRRRGG